MYVPAHFAEDRKDILHAAMRAAGLATLVTLTADGLIASHVPLLLDAEAGPNGTLVGHLARANPQATAAPIGEALVIYTGPDAYITPSWYATKREHGRVVPTWNYVTVHASGQPEFYHDADRLLALVSRLTAHHEAGQPAPWAVTDAPAAYTAQMLRAIVGVSLRIETLQGKWKLGQNRSKADQAGLLKFYDAQGAHYEPLAAAARDQK